MEKRRKNRIILSRRYSDTRFRRKKLEVHIHVFSEILSQYLPNYPLAFQQELEYTNYQS